MRRIADNKNIAVLWLVWHFWEMPRNIFRAWKNFLVFNLEYFSILLLVKTWFSFWRRYQWEYPRGFDLYKNVEIFFSNIISRGIGFLIRTCVILAGLLAEAFIILVGIIVLISWIIMPFGSIAIIVLAFFS